MPSASLLYLKKRRVEGRSSRQSAGGIISPSSVFLKTEVPSPVLHAMPRRESLHWIIFRPASEKAKRMCMSMSIWDSYIIRWRPWSASNFSKRSKGDARIARSHVDVIRAEDFNKSLNNKGLRIGYINIAECIGLIFFTLRRRQHLSTRNQMKGKVNWIRL